MKFRLTQLFDNDDFYKKLRVSIAKIATEVDVKQVNALLYFNGANTIRRDMVFLIDMALVNDFFEELHQLSTCNFLIFVYSEADELMHNQHVEKLADHYLPLGFNQAELYGALSLARKLLKGHAETIFPRKLVNTSVSEIEQLLNSIHQRVFWKNSNGQYVGCNGSFADDFQVNSVDDIIGKTDDDLLEEKSAIEFSAYDHRILAGGDKIEGFEKEIAFKDGSRKWLRISKYPHRKEGVLIGLIGHYVVVSHEEKANDQQFTNDQLLDALMNNIPDTIYFKDAESRFIKVNKAQAHLIGIESEEEAVGKTDFDFFNHEMARESFAAEQQIVFDGTPQSALENVGTSDGTFRWMNSIKAPVKNQQGNVIGLVGISRNVDEQIKIEQELIDERDLLQLLIDHIPAPIFLKNANLEFTRVNKAYVELMGLKHHDEVLGKTDFDFYPPELAAQFKKSEEEIFISGIPQLDHLEQLHFKHLGERWMSTSKMPMAHHGEKYKGIIGISYDVSKQVKNIMQLKEAWSKAEVASKAKSEYLAGMSHEIRTPLTSVINMAEVLMMSDLNKDQHKFAQIIYNSGHNLLKLVNDLLDLSKIETGNVELDPHPFSVRGLVNEVIDMLGMAAESNGNRITSNVDKQVPDQLIGDDFRCKQVLINIAGNAIKFTKNGKVHIEVKRVSESTKHSELFFSVSDTGIGIAPEVVNKIFDTYGQADRSIAKKFGGTGLGLSISKKLVNMMGGDIEVESEPGKGARFSFNISFDKASVNEHTLL
ncbi:PAS domain-containing protein [Roseimarinus sediminis]|jgi:PAS domain S-box-containing protein|uniref:PAS domain-containing protein n=1 Tax=Roseimarinus sediminis TaxID=1610899 RepID=UPI003D20C99C